MALAGGQGRTGVAAPHALGISACLAAMAMAAHEAQDELVGAAPDAEASTGSCEICKKPLTKQDHFFCEYCVVIVWLNVYC